jgi:hypothetical protein
MNGVTQHEHAVLLKEETIPDPEPYQVNELRPDPDSWTGEKHAINVREKQHRMCIFEEASKFC